MILFVDNVIKRIIWTDERGRDNGKDNSLLGIVTFEKDVCVADASFPILDIKFTAGKMQS